VVYHFATSAGLLESSNKFASNFEGKEQHKFIKTFFDTVIDALTEISCSVCASQVFRRQKNRCLLLSPGRLTTVLILFHDGTLYLIYACINEVFKKI